MPKPSITETAILEQLDLAFKQIPSPYYPAVREQDIKYNFFLDLEHGYCVTASSRIHLYSDSTSWAIVFEKSGYYNRAGSAQIELIYAGNCINYQIDSTAERNYISNTSSVFLVDGEEYERIQNNDGSEMEQFELISRLATKLKVRDVFVDIEQDPSKYEQLGIKLRDFDNPKKLIGFDDLIRYLHETNPAVISATEVEIKQHIPLALPKLMVINDFHFKSVYEKEKLPSQQETYQLIAKVLAKNDSAYWKPIHKPNNNWRNWESGNL